MSKKLIIMRGLSGSGKSTLAKELVAIERQRQVELPQIFSTDEFFFERETGEYNFDGSKLAEAHAWNQQRVEGLMRDLYAYRGGQGWQSVTLIVDNTNTMMSEAQPYVELARKYGYNVEFHEPTTPWARDPKVCAEKTKHGVPLEAIERQLARWEPFTNVITFTEDKGEAICDT